MTKFQQKPPINPINEMEMRESSTNLQEGDQTALRMSLPEYEADFISKMQNEVKVFKDCLRMI